MSSSHAGWTAVWLFTQKSSETIYEQLMKLPSTKKDARMLN